jgi:uncharacterized membrane protein
MEPSTMSRVNLAAIPFLLLLAVACGEPKVGTRSAEPPATETGSEPSSTGPVRGILTIVDGVTTLRECGAPAKAATTLADPAGELAAAFASLNADPSGGIYVELEGLQGKLLRASGRKEGAGCDTPVFEGEFVASGNEPFWAVEIRENGIVYRSPELPTGRIYPYAFTRTASDAVIYATKTEGPVVSTLEVSLEPERCVDSMSGELRSFKARVALDGRSLSGCAITGVPRGEFGDAPLDELNRFAGAYPHTVHLWDDPVIHERLKTLLGPSMKAFVENMKVQSPVMKDGGVFYVTGNRPHQGGSDNAIFLADPASDTLAVILFVNGTRRSFNEGGREVVLPDEIVTMIGNRDNR